MGEKFREWKSMGADFRETLTFREFCKLKQNEKGKGYGTQNYKLHHSIGKMYFPTYMMELPGAQHVLGWRSWTHTSS